MDALSDSLDKAKWHKMDVSMKKEFKEYQVMRQHKKLDPTSWGYFLQPEGDEDPIKVIIRHTNKDKDPLKDIGTAELQLKDNIVTGIDLDGDCFQLAD